MVIAADAADAAGDEVCIPRIFALHKNAVSAENGGGAIAFGHLFIFEVDFGENSQAAHDSGNRVPVHLHEISLLVGLTFESTALSSFPCFHPLGLSSFARERMVYAPFFGL